MSDDMTAGPDDAQAAQQPLLRRGVLREAAAASDSYGLLLFLILIDYVLLSVDWTGGWALITDSFFIGITALLGFHTSHVRGHLLRAVRVAAAAALLAAIIAAIAGPTPRTQGIIGLVLALLILSTPVAVLSRIVKHERVTAETLLGAICVYVMLGLVFAYADVSVFRINGDHFFAQSTPPGGFNSPDFVYFSFITMTTVGYGDLSPANGFPRTMAVFEALTGQIFLVVMVSRLVAMYTPKPRPVGRRGLIRARAATIEGELGDEDDAGATDVAEAGDLADEDETTADDPDPGRGSGSAT
jgi:hypothetical protein